MKEPLIQLENGNVAVKIFDDFSARLIDKQHNADWSMAPACYEEIADLSDKAIWNRQERCYMDRYPAFFRAQQLDSETLKVTVLDPLREERGNFICHVALRDKWISFSIEDIDEQLPSLIFPPYIESEKLVIPRNIGQLHSEKAWSMESTFVMPASGWCMRWFGGLKGNNGWIGIIDEGYGDSGLYYSNLSACAAWQKTLGKWQGKKTVIFGFSDNGYVGLAKLYRHYAKENGLFKSLRQKIEEVPSVKNLIGGRCISFFQSHTYHKENFYLGLQPVPPDADEKDGKVQVQISHKDVANIIAEAKQAGMKQGYFNLRGWLDGGYDETHPDVWPPEPALGSIDEFKKVTTENDPFLTILHDNYQDMYARVPSFPKWVMRTPDGRPKAGGTWHGGRCYIINSEKSMEYVKRNWENLKTLGLRGAFLDTIGGAHLQEDYDPDHMLTRTQDAEAKLDIAKFYKDKGMVVGTEYGADFCINLADFFETRTPRIPGFSIPLLQLVYHDAVVTHRYKSGTDDFDASSDIEDIMWGYAKLWPAGNLENWRKNIDGFKKSFCVDEFHSRVGLDEMVNHKYLNSEGTIEQTEFSSGLSVIANFTDESVTFDGKTIGAQDYVILD